MDMKKILTICLLIVIGSCTRQDVGNVAKAQIKTALEQQRDNVISNYQSQIKELPECSIFKDQLWSKGQNHKSNASGAFANDMISVLKNADQAGCRV